MSPFSSLVSRERPGFASCVFCFSFRCIFFSKRVHSVVPGILVMHVTRVPPVERVGHEIAVFVGLIWLCYFIFWNWSRKHCWYTIVNEHRQIRDESDQLLYTHTSMHTKSSYFNKNRMQVPSLILFSRKIYDNLWTRMSIFDQYLSLFFF